MSLLFIFFAAILNAVMDILENENFYHSIFRDCDPKIWYKRESWKYAKKTFGYKWDGWHIAKSGMIIFLYFSVVFYEPMFTPFIDLFIFGVLWNLTFNLSYRLMKK